MLDAQTTCVGSTLDLLRIIRYSLGSIGTGGLSRGLSPFFSLFCSTRLPFVCSSLLWLISTNPSPFVFISTASSSSVNSPTSTFLFLSLRPLRFRLVADTSSFRSLSQPLPLPRSKQQTLRIQHRRYREHRSSFSDPSFLVSLESHLVLVLLIPSFTEHHPNPLPYHLRVPKRPHQEGRDPANRLLCVIPFFSLRLSSRVRNNEEDAPLTPFLFLVCAVRSFAGKMFEADGWGNHGWGEPAGKDGKPGYNTCHFWTNFGEFDSKPSKPASFLSLPFLSPFPTSSVSGSLPLAASFDPIIDLVRS